MYSQAPRTPQEAELHRAEVVRAFHEADARIYRADLVSATEAIIDFPFPGTGPSHVWLQYRGGYDGPDHAAVLTIASAPVQDREALWSRLRLHVAAQPDAALPLVTLDDADGRRQEVRMCTSPEGAFAEIIHGDDVVIVTSMRPTVLPTRIAVSPHPAPDELIDRWMRAADLA